MAAFGTWATVCLSLSVYMVGTDWARGDAGRVP